MPIDGPDDLRIPVIEERLHVDTAQAKVDHVRVRTLVETYLASTERDLRTERLAVSRIAADYEVAEAPLPRQVGDTLVIPVVEERMVVETRLFVIEEVHVTRTAHVETASLTAELRRMHAVVERDGREHHDRERE